ncbi:diaminopimelate epimerase [Streptomyces olivoreticuli]
MTTRVPDVTAHPFAKGHGAGNDFIVLPDPDGQLVLSAGDVTRLCDRRTGIGADGILRAVRCAADPEAAAMAAQAEWFMDYRNADGSNGAMCGNGIRVLARYLVDAALCLPGTLPIATRAGIRQVHVPHRSPAFQGPVTVSMGHPELPDTADAEVAVAERRWAACHVDMGNPHAVVFVDDLAHAGDLRATPTVEPADAYPLGVTVEFVVDRGPGHLALRVHERGVGETQACGTGACAAVAAAMRRAARPAPAHYIVDAPGGRLSVEVLPDGAMKLTGPAAIVAQGTTGLTLSRSAWGTDSPYPQSPRTGPDSTGAYVVYSRNSYSGIVSTPGHTPM